MNQVDSPASCAIYINLGAGLKTELLPTYNSCLKQEIESTSVGSVASVYMKLGSANRYKPLVLDMSGILNNRFSIRKSTEITLEIEYPGITMQELARWKRIGVNRINVCYTQDVGSISDLTSYIKELHQMFDMIALDVHISKVKRGWLPWRSFFEGLTEIDIVHCSIQDNTNYCFAYYCSSIGALFECAGFEQYELLNFAKRNYQSRYMNYFWNRYPLYGFGAGAHSCIGRLRVENEPDPQQYCRAMGNKARAVCMTEQLTDEQQTREEIVLNIRRNVGIPVTSIREKLSTRAFAHFMKTVVAVVKEGFVELQQERITLTKKGQVVEQAVVQKLLSECYNIV